MVPLPSPRDRRPRVTPVMLLLLATLALAGVLTYQAADAAGSHRKTAERALKDHATFAAFEYSRLARKELEWQVWNALKPLIYFAPADPSELATPRQLAEARAKLADCDCPTTGYFRAYFAVNLQTGATIWHGDLPSHEVRAWVSDSVCAHARTAYGERWGLCGAPGPAQGWGRTPGSGLLRPAG